MNGCSILCGIQRLTIGAPDALYTEGKKEREVSYRQEKKDSLQSE